MILICDQRTIDEMSPEEQQKLLGTILDDMEGEGFTFATKRTRKSKPKNGAYRSCEQWAPIVGRSAKTLREKFRNKGKREGVEKRIFSGRGRRTYPVILVSETAIKREFPDIRL